MDVSGKIDKETKATLRDLNLECQVLRNLLVQREAMLKEVLAETFNKLDASPNLYVLKIDAVRDLWELQLKPSALLVPNVAINEAVRRTMANPERN